MPPATPPWPIAPAPGRRNGSRFPAASRVPASSAGSLPAPSSTRGAAPAVSWLYGATPHRRTVARGGAQYRQEELVAAVAVTQREEGAAGAEHLRRESGHAPFHQKLNLACSSTMRPMSAEEDIPKKELSGCVPLSLKEKGLRLSWLKTLKKFARSSRSDFSLIQGRCVCLAKFKSVWKNRGPRKELRPTPGGPLALILK